MSESITKQQLLNQLEHTKNNYILGLAAASLFQTGRAAPLLQTHLAAFGTYFITFDQVAALLQNPPDRHIAINELLKMLIRTLIKESFEHIKDYCRDTNQFDRLKSQSWYEFARLIRNFLSHNCRFEFNIYDRQRLPITWKDRTITPEMDGQTLDLAFFGYVQTWELFEEFEKFITTILT